MQSTVGSHIIKKYRWGTNRLQEVVMGWFTKKKKRYSKQKIIIDPFNLLKKVRQINEKREDEHTKKATEVENKLD